MIFKKPFQTALKIFLSLAGDRCEQCSDIQCENGATCRLNWMNGSSTTFCSCAEGYHGEHCQYSVCTNYCKNVSYGDVIEFGFRTKLMIENLTQPFYNLNKLNLSLSLSCNRETAVFIQVSQSVSVMKVGLEEPVTLAKMVSIVLLSPLFYH